MLRTTLRVPVPFSLAATIDSHGWLWARPFAPEVAANRLHRVERIRGRPRLITVRALPSHSNRVTLEATSDALPQDRDAVRKVVTTTLGLQEDLGAFYAMAARDKRLAPVVTQGAGRTVRGTSLWEDAFKGITQTNTLWKQALVTMERICALGPKHSASGIHAFPTPDEVLDAGADWLRDTARVGYRAESLIALAEGVAAGALDLADLERRAPAMDTGALIKELKSIRGIGPATAQMLAGFLGKHDLVSVDSSTIAYVRTYYPGAYKGNKPTPAEAAAVFDRYGPWKGKAWWYEAWLAKHVNGQGERATTGEAN